MNMAGFAQKEIMNSVNDLYDYVIEDAVIEQESMKEIDIRRAFFNTQVYRFPLVVFTSLK